MTPITEIRALLSPRPRGTTALDLAADALGCVVGVDEYEEGRWCAYAERGPLVVAEGYADTPTEARCRLAIELAAIMKRASEHAATACVEEAERVRVEHTAALLETMGANPVEVQRAFGVVFRKAGK